MVCAVRVVAGTPKVLHGGFVMGLSIISSPAGMMPAAITAATRVARFAHIVETGHDTKRRQLGLGTGLTVTSVTTASMPSLPIMTASGPGRGVERIRAELDGLAFDAEAFDLELCTVSLY